MRESGFEHVLWDEDSFSILFLPTYLRAYLSTYLPTYIHAVIHHG